MPVELGSFNGIISMDWFSNYRIASIVAREQRVELFDRIGTLERDNMRLRGMLGVERQRVDCLWRSMSYAQRDLRDPVPHPGELQYCSSKRRMDPLGYTSTTEN
ncbi:hypothetical protein Tco_0892771 [Tanacetum coccineum]|uniref:Uncharacterized protein n=1 Tax=Tanacetum coccineum TaxID=301880 RepID=A0ABQ5C8E2_9ASTR